MKKAPQRFSRLTSTRVLSLQPGDHTDPASRGLQLRVTRSKGTTRRAWLYRYKWEGATVRLLLGTFPAMPLADARSEAEKFRQYLDRGIDPRRTRDRRRGAPMNRATVESDTVAAKDRHTVTYLVRLFIEKHLRPRRKRPEQAERALNADVLPVWRHRDPRTITPAEVIELLDGIVERGSPMMANRTATLLGQLFKFAIHRGLVTTSPVQLLYRPGGDEKPRTRALSDDEIGTFLACIENVMRSPRTAAALKILLLTGQRRGELVLARWREIDLDGGAWEIPAENSKTGVGHTVPLSAPAVAEFRLLKKMASRSAFVLPRENGEGAANPMIVTRSVARCSTRFKKVGLEKFTPHDLRRTVRTGLARLSVAPHVAERVLNHAQEEIARTYNVHDYAEEKRAALDLWANHLAGLQLAASREAGK